MAGRVKEERVRDLLVGAVVVAGFFVGGCVEKGSIPAYVTGPSWERVKPYAVQGIESDTTLVEIDRESLLDDVLIIDEAHREAED